MFHDLDNTITQLLSDPAMKPGLNELFDANVSFITPDKNFTLAGPAINLFLYEVKENRDLRDPTPIIEKINGSFIRKEPPLRICIRNLGGVIEEFSAIGKRNLVYRKMRLQIFFSRDDTTDYKKTRRRTRRR
jgi:hypothetical protein